MLYAGAIDNCKLTHGLDSYSSGEVFDTIVMTLKRTQLQTFPSTHFKYVHVKTDCRWPVYHFPCTVYPGETFQVSVVAVGQRNGRVPSTVRSAIDNIQYPDDKLLDSEHLQQTDNTCTKLNYTVFHCLSLWRWCCMQKVAHVRILVTVYYLF